MELQSGQNNSEKNKVGGLSLTDIKTYSKGEEFVKSLQNKIICYWHKDKHVNQWNTIQHPEKMELRNIHHCRAFPNRRNIQQFQLPLLFTV